MNGDVLAVAIVGAGFSGLAAAATLRRAGVTDITILERADDLGGTWRDNTYPGCACDVRSHMYSFSFAQNPGWTREYATQPEILDYLRDTATQLDLRRHIRFGVALHEARWDEEAACWRLQTSQGLVTARSLILATGPFRHPKLPQIEGIQSFAGPAFHSARWDHDVPLSQARVAVVGTGASAVQIVPALARRVRHLTLFQRTPAWILPRWDRPISPATRAVYRHVPLAMRLRRLQIYLAHELRGHALLHDGLVRWGAHRLAAWHRARQVDDITLREQLTPAYDLGCKRILLSNDFYPALQQEHVRLVPHGVRAADHAGLLDTQGEHHPVDVIIWATGFQLPDPMHDLQIIGRGGQTLHQAWSTRVEAYEGTMVHGFPNMFTMLGPNTGLGHNSVVFMAEAQLARVREVVARVESGVTRAIEVRRDAQDRYNEAVHTAARTRVWASSCTSWYVDQDGHNATLWPHESWRFWWRLRRYRLRDHTEQPGRASAP